MKRMSALAVVVCASCTLLVDARAVMAATEGIILTAAPQDAEVFATWSPIPGATYLLRWKGANATGWSVLDAGVSTFRAVTNLPNGVSHIFQVEARFPAGDPIFSAMVESTPRPRPDCAAINYYPWLPPVSFFCTKTALDEYLSQRGIDPLALRCRQRQVTVWNVNAPDCLYTTPQGDHLLLLRSADTSFAGGKQYPSVSTIRRTARRAIWGEDDPFASPLVAQRTALPAPLIGNVAGHAYAQSFDISYPGGFPSRITWFVPTSPVAGRYAIYHEGHGGAAIDLGTETIDWLLGRGWSVIAVDMPLIGLNGISARPGLEAHGQFESLDDGVRSPLRFFVTPLRAIVDWIFELEQGRNPDILLIGRSGGGLSAYLYGALDPRIDIVVSVAGGRPISERLDAPWGAAELGDYEQTAPYLYDVVGHEHLMLAAGSKGSLFFFNEWDSCCFRIQPDSEFVQYLSGGSEQIGKRIEVFVDQENAAHSIGPQGYIELETFLGRVLAVAPRVPTPPSGMRIIGR